MNFNDVLEPVETFLTWSFGLLEKLGNSFNFTVITLGFVGLFIWLTMQYNYNKRAKADSNQIK